MAFLCLFLKFPQTVLHLVTFHAEVTSLCSVLILAPLTQFVVFWETQKHVKRGYWRVSLCGINCHLGQTLGQSSLGHLGQKITEYKCILYMRVYIIK